jgi:UDP-N-acetylmuramyl pentapeptide synthase
MDRLSHLKRFDSRQYWRFIVDGRLHRKYSGWVGYDSGEPGSIKAILNGIQYAVDCLPKCPSNITVRHLAELHKICLTDVTLKTRANLPGEFKFLPNSIPLFAKSTTLAGIEALIEARHDETRSIFFDAELQQPVRQLDTEYIYKQLQLKKKLSYIPWYPELSPKLSNALKGLGDTEQYYRAKFEVQQAVLQKTQGIFEKFQTEISVVNTDAHRLRAIARLVKNLEILHPFSDGNCRVFAVVLLLELLLAYGFPPTILSNPNLDAEVGLDEWIKEIELGFERTKLLLENPETELFGYSIAFASPEDIAKFDELATPLATTIRNYSEIAITPLELEQVTDGRWIAPQYAQRYRSVNDLLGGLYFDRKSIKSAGNKEGTENLSLDREGNPRVAAIVIDSESKFITEKIPRLVVQDVELAFEAAASYARKSVNPRTILITGTEGKTGAKIQLQQLLSSQTRSHAVFNSANARIPVLATLLSLERDHTVEIVEFSVDANKEKTISGSKIVNPDICFFTNISTEHMHNHKTLAGVITAKASVVFGLKEDGAVFLNSSIDAYHKLRKQILINKPQAKILTYGKSESDYAQLIDARFDPQNFCWHVSARIDDVIVEYRVPFVQSHAALCSVGLLGLVKYLNFDALKAGLDFEKIASYESMGSLIEIECLDGAAILYDHSRRSSIAGVRSVFEDLKNIGKKRRIIALFGSISSVTRNEWTEKYQLELAHLVDNSEISMLFTTGPNSELTRNAVTRREILRTHSDDIFQLYREIGTILRGGDLLVVMGYMRLNLHRLSSMLQRRDIRDLVALKNSYGWGEPEFNRWRDLLLRQRTDQHLRTASVKVEPATLNDSYRHVSIRGSFSEGAGYLLNEFFRFFEQRVKQRGFTILQVSSAQKSGSDSSFELTSCQAWFEGVVSQSVDRPVRFGLFFLSPQNPKLIYFAIVGTTNLHLGVSLNSRGVPARFHDMQHTAIRSQLNSGSPEIGEFRSRSWGVEPITLDCGDFANLSNWKVYEKYSCNDESPFLVGKIYPFLDKASTVRFESSRL